MVVVEFSPTLEKILQLLSDGECWSGESLGMQLGISRAGVAKYIPHLRELGLTVSVERGRGYRLSSRLELLNQQFIRETVGEGIEVDVFQKVDSTNSHIMDRARANKKIAGYACLAESQLAGRGRRGRAWQSPYGKNIYLSLGWTFHTGVSAVEGLSLAVGVVVCDVLEALGFTGAQLKWPNDILVDGHKLGGVLIELLGDSVGECSVVIGLGLNVSMLEEDAADVDQRWTSLALQGAEMNRSLLASHLISSLFDLLGDYSQQGFGPHQSRWNSLSAYSGAEVGLISPAHTIVGVYERCSRKRGCSAHC